ncbi:GDSL esterase/lipase At5g03980-like [Silene latifolia]|uniref:GDSL esterase/lipase At5g03980-like n=1 Tax=Silene latifolia TaxID=37657 RepID=UPI003D775F73
MFIHFLHSSFFIATLFISCLATICLSNNFADHNLIKLPSHHASPRTSFHFLSFPSSKSPPINAIYQFGDSLSDTGNLIRADPSTNCANWPYGESYFNEPTGRCSNGLLVIDYFAKFLNLPLLDAYLNKDGNFTHGVNFAVASAAALNSSVLGEKYNVWAPTNLTLSVQLGWFKSHLHSFYPNVLERRNKLAKGLFLMGEVGGNDYNFAFTQGKPLPDVYEMVPDVVQKIKSAVEEIIDLGATQIGIPGNFPIGCMPMYLSQFKTNDSSKYDELKCLKEYNRHAIYHNDQLQQTIIELQKSNPNVTIVYMDYFGTLKEILRHSTLYGFDANVTTKACCGAGDDEYNVNSKACCGDNGVPVCKNPQEYVSWDGTHLTQQAYYVMAKKLMPSLLRSLQNVADNLVSQS